MSKDTLRAIKIAAALTALAIVCLIAAGYVGVLTDHLRDSKPFGMLYN